MKHLAITFFVLSTIVAHAQWPQFNRAHPVACQSPAFNYTAHGAFENVFVIDTLPNFYDGYLLFGSGILEHPDSVENYTRTFAAKCNTNGDLVWWRRYDDEGIDQNEQWYNFFDGNPGGMILNHLGQITSIYTTFVDSDSFNEETKNYLVTFDIQGEILSQHLVDSSLANFSFNGLIEDLTDSTYVTYGWRQSPSDVMNYVPPSAFLMKIDTLGNEIWLKEYSNAFSVWPGGGVVKAMDGGFWVTIEKGNNACSDGFFANTDLVVIKTDEFGNEEDRIVLGGVCGKEMGTVYEYEQDKIILAGRMTLEETNLAGIPYEGFLYTTLLEQQADETISETGPMKQYIQTFDGNFVDFHVLPDGTFLIVNDAGFTEANGTGPDGRVMGCLLKLDENRDSIWAKTYTVYDNVPTIENMPFAQHYILDSKTTPDGGLVCSGWIQQHEQDPNPFLQTPWLFKVDSLGCLEPGCHLVNVEEITIGLENTLSAYPNPTSGLANIT
ncbi:MAG: hypothetical protein GC193_07105, partial [Cryomorphaceae bacterium]|nr:hypothetical protein [Cryomorphaceae bacterium]